MSEPSPTPETLADLLPATPDVRSERLAELKRLFPDLFTNEGRLNPDELRQLVRQLEARRKTINPENTTSAPARQGEARPNQLASEASFNETTKP